MAKLVERRYATALFDLAKSEDKLASYEQEVKVIVKVLHDESDFMAVLKDHKVTVEEKVTLVETIFNGKVADPILGLLVLLIKKGRQEEMIGVLETFLECVEKESGIIRAVVTSAVPLKESQVATLKANIEASTKCKIELETIVDTSIIAGLIVRVGDKVVDASIKGEMQTLKKQLSEIRLA